jgi:hypothetical protein
MTGRSGAQGPFDPMTKVPRRPKGVRIPSIADDVATDLITIFSRTSGLRR